MNRTFACVAGGVALFSAGVYSGALAASSYPYALELDTVRVMGALPAEARGVLGGRLPINKERRALFEAHVKDRLLDGTLSRRGADRVLCDLKVKDGRTLDYMTMGDLAAHLAGYERVPDEQFPSSLDRVIRGTDRVLHMMEVGAEDAD